MTAAEGIWVNFSDEKKVYIMPLPSIVSELIKEVILKVFGFDDAKLQRANQFQLFKQKGDYPVPFEAALDLVTHGEDENHVWYVKHVDSGGILLSESTEKPVPDQDQEAKQANPSWTKASPLSEVLLGKFDDVIDLFDEEDLTTLGEVGDLEPDDWEAFVEAGVSPEAKAFLLGAVSSMKREKVTFKPDTRSSKPHMHVIFGPTDEAIYIEPVPYDVLGLKQQMVPLVAASSPIGGFQAHDLDIYKGKAELLGQESPLPDDQVLTDKIIEYGGHCICMPGHHLPSADGQRRMKTAILSLMGRSRSFSEEMGSGLDDANKNRTSSVGAVLIHNVHEPDEDEEKDENAESQESKQSSVQDGSGAVNGDADQDSVPNSMFSPLSPDGTPLDAAMAAKLQLNENENDAKEKEKKEKQEVATSPQMSPETRAKVRRVMRRASSLARISSATTALLPCSVFHDRFELGKVLGKGQFATVYQAKHRRSNEDFAVKIIQKYKIHHKIPSMNVLYDEVAIWKSVVHRHVARVISVFEDSKELMIVIELARGGELFERLIHLGKYTEKDAIEVARNIFSALDHLHVRGIVHRDLKPENILLASQSHYDIKLSDFGLARVVDDEEFLLEACGTPGFMAPEVVALVKKVEKQKSMTKLNLNFEQEKEEKKEGQNQNSTNGNNSNSGYTAKADVWSAGYPPFADDDVNNLLQKISDCKIEYREDVWSQVSSNGRDFVKKILTADPNERLSAREALQHPWLKIDVKSIPVFHLSNTIGNLQAYAARKRFKNAIGGVRSLVRLSQPIRKLRKAHSESSLLIYKTGNGNNGRNGNGIGMMSSVSGGPLDGKKGRGKGQDGDGDESDGEIDMDSGAKPGARRISEPVRPGMLEPLSLTDTRDISDDEM